MKFQIETINEFESILNSINSNNNNLIRALSLFAEEYKGDDAIASIFVNLIETKIIEAYPNLKIYFLYVLDCIVKNVGFVYLDLFSKNLKEIFITALQSITEVNEKSKYYLIRKSWESYFSVEILKDIDYELCKIDENWANECMISPNSVESSSTNSNYDSLQSLPIINSKLKSENYVLLKTVLPFHDANISPYLDCNKENEDIELSDHVGPSWKITIPDYPLFPDIGTDPRLLRRWYSNEKTEGITINNKIQRLLLDRIQPCIVIKNLLHAVRFFANKIELKVDETAFPVSLVGTSRIQIFNKPYHVCLGGPGHELIIMGLPYRVPMDGGRHNIRFSNANLSLQWLVDNNVDVKIMPAIPTHISEWGWKGMFGSPRYLMQHPLNPMKPALSGKFKSSIPRLNKTNAARVRVGSGENIINKNSDFNLRERSPQIQRKYSVSQESDDCDNRVWSDCSRISVNERLSLKDLQKSNHETVLQLYETRKCLLCNRKFNYSDEICFSDHLLQHHTDGRCYQLLNDWITSAASLMTPVTSEDLSAEIIPKSSSLFAL